MIYASTNIEEIKAEIQKRVAILAQTLQGADRDKLMLETRNALNLASEGELGEFDIELLTWAMASDTEWDDVISLLKLLNDLVKESHPETPNPENPKPPFGFSAIAADVKNEIAASEAKRIDDRRFVRAIINDVVGDYGLTEISCNGMHDEDIRMGLNTDAFRNITQFIMRDIESIINPRLDDSGTLREFSDLLHKAYTAAIRPCVWEYNSHWTEYLNAFCPDAMKRIEESDCQFKAECKRSLTFIALRLELGALKAAFPTEVASDDDEWI